MRRFQSPRAVSTGFTLIELLLVVVVLMIVAGAVSIIGTSALRREELNSISVGLASWLETVQRASRRHIHSNSSERPMAGCQVVFTPGKLTSNAVIATASPSSNDSSTNPEIHPCGVPTEFRLPHRIHDLNLKLTVDSGDNPIGFTPRGTTTSTTPLVIRVSGSGGRARCVRVSAILGLISIGSDPKGEASTCPEPSYDGAT